MKADDSAVAGFFEDLPVLMFVLGGVLVLVLSSVWVSRIEVEQRMVEELERSAEALADGLLARVRGQAYGAVDPSIPSIECLDLSRLTADLAGNLGRSVAFVELYPEARWVISWSTGNSTGVSMTGSHSALFNVRDAWGNTAVMEVRVVVWQA